MTATSCWFSLVVFVSSQYCKQNVFCQQSCVDTAKKLLSVHKGKKSFSKLAVTSKKYKNRIYDTSKYFPWIGKVDMCIHDTKKKNIKLVHMDFVSIQSQIKHVATLKPEELKRCYKYNYLLRQQRRFPFRKKQNNFTTFFRDESWVLRINKMSFMSKFKIHKFTI